MIHGFDTKSDLVCEGIVGDGCGGGRIFYIKDEILFAYDSITKESIPLLKEIKNARKLTKKSCIVSIECLEKTLKFDLSSL